MTGLDAPTIGGLALANGLGVHELRPLRSSVEDVYSRVTDSSVEYRADGKGGVREQEVRR